MFDHEQAVKGLEKKVPVTRISYEGGDKAYFYAHRKEARPEDSAHERAETKRKYDRLVEQVRALTGLKIKTFRGRYAGGTFEMR